MEINNVVSYKLSIFDRIKDTITNTQTFEIRIKDDILYRTELMCMAISEQLKKEFDPSDLVTILYMDFVKYAIKNYNPERVLKEATIKNYQNEMDNYIKLITDGKEYVYKKNNRSYTTVLYRLNKREVKKGELILNELNDLYKVKIPFEVLISNLWTNFIEDYKLGKNKRAYTSIVKLLKIINF